MPPKTWIACLHDIAQTGHSPHTCARKQMDKRGSGQPSEQKVVTNKAQNRYNTLTRVAVAQNRTKFHGLKCDPGEIPSE